MFGFGFRSYFGCTKGQLFHILRSMTYAPYSVSGLICESIL